MSRRILLEGLDFAGKSTLAQGLLERFRSRQLCVTSGQNCLCAHNPIAALAERVAGEPDRHPLEASSLFLASHLWDLRHYPADTPGIHIQDSCWLRAKAYDRRQGVPLPWDQMVGVDFSAVIFLTAAIPVRQWRGRKLGAHSGRHWIFYKVDQFLALEHHLRQDLSGRPNFLEIDTSKLSPGETLNRAWEYLESRGLCQTERENLGMATCQG